MIHPLSTSFAAAVVSRTLNLRSDLCLNTLCNFPLYNLGQIDDLASAILSFQICKRKVMTFQTGVSAARDTYIKNLVHWGFNRSGTWRL